MVPCLFFYVYECPFFFLWCNDKISILFADAVLVVWRLRKNKLFYMKDIFKPNLALIAMSFIVAGVMTIKPLREALLNLLDVGLPVLAWAGFLLLSVVWSINYVKAARVSKARVTQNYKPTLLDYIRHGLPAIVVFSLGIGITLLIPNHLLQSNPFLPLLYILPLGGLLALWIWARVNDKIKF